MIDQRVQVPPFDHEMRLPSGLKVPRNIEDIINSLLPIICPLVVMPFSSVIVILPPGDMLTLVGLPASADALLPGSGTRMRSALIWFSRPRSAI
jgi:hypothetical protein